MRNLGDGDKLEPLNTRVGNHQQGVRLEVGSNDVEQKAQIGKVMGRVQDNRGK